MNQEVMKTMCNWFLSLPHSAAIGLRFVESEGEGVTLAVDWREALVGNPVTGSMHSGVITSLIDTCSGLSVFKRLEHIEAVFTLDLRIDHLRMAERDLPIFCRAHCYRLTPNIGFTRAVCYQTTPDDPITHSVGTFMRSQTPLNLQGAAS